MKKYMLKVSYLMTICCLMANTIQCFLAKTLYKD